MNENRLGKGMASVFGQDQTMTVKDVAVILGVTPEAIKKWVRELFPEAIRDGVATVLNQSQITTIKARMLPTTQVVAATTDLEMIQQGAAFANWAMRKLEEAQRHVAILEPKAEAFDSFVRSDRELSITDAAKHFGYKRGEVFVFLRTKGYLTQANMPSSKAIDDNILTIREVNIGVKVDGTPKFTSQAVVHSAQMDNFRRVIERGLGARNLIGDHLNN